MEKHKHPFVLLLSGLAVGLALAAGGCREHAEPAPELLQISVVPKLETAPSQVPGSDADDPALWFHPTDPGKNLVFACQKEGGYSIYDVRGETLVDERAGNVRYNNVAVVTGFPLPDGPADLAVFSDRFEDTLALYTISGSAPYLRAVEIEPGEPLFTGRRGEDTAYGLGAYQNPHDGDFYAIVTQNDHNRVRLVRLAATDTGVRLEPVQFIELAAGSPGAHAEGVVYDPAFDRFLIAQEAVGLYAIGRSELAALGPEAQLDESHLVHAVGDYGLTADLEGIDWINDEAGPGFVILSSQGNNRFLIMHRENLEPLAMLEVAAGDAIDGSEASDGLAAVARPFGPLFPDGILIVHDGEETPNPDLPAERTNFKWVDWAEVRSQLP